MKKTINNQNDPPRTQRIITVNKYIEKLFPLGQSISLPPDTIFIRPSDPPDYCYIVKSGIVVGTEIYPNGIVREGLIMAPYSMIGEAFVLLNEPSPITFRTVLQSELIRISRDSLMQALSEEPELYKIITESLTKKFLSSMDEIRQMATSNVTWRICNLLEIFATYYGEEINGNIRINIRLSQQILSKLLCVNRITTVRIIKKMKDLQLIKQINGYYWIVDPEALSEYKKQNETV